MTSNVVYYQRCKGFLSAKVGEEEIALFDPANPDFYFGLSETSKTIWELVEKPVSRTKLVEQLSEIYEANTSEIESDTSEFLKELVEQRIVEIV